jgi:hypothetical protein
MTAGPPGLRFVPWCLGLPSSSGFEGADLNRSQFAGAAPRMIPMGIAPRSLFSPGAESCWRNLPLEPVQGYGSGAIPRQEELGAPPKCILV